MLDAGVSRRDVQIAARHADPRTTMRYDRARKNLDRHPNYILERRTRGGKPNVNPQIGPSAQLPPSVRDARAPRRTSQV